MRALIGLAVVLAAAPVAAKSSNPAFLGVSFPPNGGRCVIAEVTPGGSASIAGLRSGDEVLTLDGAVVPSCDVLVTMIQAHELGQSVKIEVRRNGSVLAMRTLLLTRTEVLRRRYVGKIVPTVDAVRYDDRNTTELFETRKTTIVGWFDPKCTNCLSAFSSVAKWARNRKHIRVLAAIRRPMTGDLSELKPIASVLDAPLVVTDSESYQTFTIADLDRVYFTVIDCKGLVTEVVPIVSDADDVDAALDELFAAAEQAFRRTE